MLDENEEAVDGNLQALADGAGEMGSRHNVTL
jgi:hypothetical protein